MAAAEIRAARADLDTCDSLAKKQRWDEIGELVKRGPISKFEPDILIILGSDAISAQDKKDIGTIRRYGVGADVLIMLGGLKEELGGGKEEGVEDDSEAATVNGSQVKFFISRSKASMDEVLLILKANKI